MVAHRARLWFHPWPYPVAGLLPLLLFTVLPGCGQKVELPKEMPRPVSVLVLKKSDPARRLRLAGAVKAWKEEQVSFEVSGRVEWTVDEGTEVQGRTFDENGKLLTAGTVLARVEPRRYELRVTSAEAQARAARAQANALKIAIEQVLPEQLKSSQANLTRATKEFERAQRLRQREAGTQAELDTAEAEFKSARAGMDQLLAERTAKEAEQASLEARAQEALEAVKEAKLDLKHCELFCPFDGRVAKVQVIPGAFVDPGRAVVTVVVMDPIKVNVAVSPARDRQFALGDVVQVFPPGSEEPERGWIYTKETVADSRTRTFSLSIMVRNWLVPMDVLEGVDIDALPKIAGLTGCYRVTKEKDAPLCVDIEALHRNSEGHYVWQAVGGSDGQRQGGASPVFVAKRVPIRLGEEKVALLGMILREIADAGGLTPRDLLVMGAPEGLEDGNKVVYIRKRWLFRPGDVATVLLHLPEAGDGLYVPMDVIRPIGEQRGHVFVVADGKAQRAAVKLLGHVGDQFRIEPADPGQAQLVREGAQLINKDIHFLVPGEPVRVVKMQGGEQ